MPLADWQKSFFRITCSSEIFILNLSGFKLKSTKLQTQLITKLNINKYKIKLQNNKLPITCFNNIAIKMIEIGFISSQ